MPHISKRTTKDLQNLLHRALSVWLLPDAEAVEAQFFLFSVAVWGYSLRFCTSSHLNCIHRSKSPLEVDQPLSQALQPPATIPPVALTTTERATESHTEHSSSCLTHTLLVSPDSVCGCKTFCICCPFQHIYVLRSSLLKQKSQLEIHVVS